MDQKLIKMDQKLVKIAEEYWIQKKIVNFGSRNSASFIELFERLYRPATFISDKTRLKLKKQWININKLLESKSKKDSENTENIDNESENSNKDNDISSKPSDFSANFSASEVTNKTHESAKSKKERENSNKDSDISSTASGLSANTTLSQVMAYMH
jgi:hypothetical protein